jgi:hypothetical protein
LVFQDAYVSIQIFSLDFRPAGANTASGKTIGPKYKLGAMPLTTDRLGWQ